MPRSLSISEAKQRAGRFCSFRERSPKEVLDKLMSWGLPEGTSVKVLRELIDLGFVDEQRFANAYCNDKFEFNSWGKQKIKANIYVHKLPDGVVQAALDRIDPNKYEARLLALARQKWDRLEKETRIKRKQKTVAYLANKGFELDLVWKAVEKLES